MESKMKLFGHPIHPMLVAIPLGLFITAILFDTIGLFVKNPVFGPLAFYDISVAIVGGLLAAVFGFADWLSIHGNTRAKQIGAWHGIGNVTLVLLFAVSWFFRLTDTGFAPSVLALVFSYAGIVLGSVTAWLGGELVFRLGVGPDRDAGLNAPNSLTEQGSKTAGNLALHK